MCVPLSVSVVPVLLVVIVMELSVYVPVAVDVCVEMVLLMV